jgi:hypothetical protein
MKGKRYINSEKKLNIKNILLMLLALAIIVLAATITKQAYAYLIHKDAVKNDIVLGYNTITLQENYEPPLTMEKGISFTKEPYATNTGNVDCYVRIKSVISDSRVADGITIDYNTEDYTYNSQDGYWYYKNAISPGQSTRPLFTTVSISSEADDKVLDGFDIYVYAESVQTVEGKTMQETWNYFK